MDTSQRIYWPLSESLRAGCILLWWMSRWWSRQRLREWLLTNPQHTRLGTTYSKDCCHYLLRRHRRSSKSPCDIHCPWEQTDWPSSSGWKVKRVPTSWDRNLRSSTRCTNFSWRNYEGVQDLRAAGSSRIDQMSASHVCQSRSYQSRFSGSGNYGHVRIDGEIAVRLCCWYSLRYFRVPEESRP